MRLTLDSLRLSVQPDGSWHGDASLWIDGVQWSGRVAVGKQAQAEIRHAIAAIRDDEPWHGTTSGYTNHGCRCPECREAQNEYLKAWRQRRRKVKQCISCEAKSRGWRCVACEQKHRELRDQRMQRSA